MGCAAVDDRKPSTQLVAPLLQLQPLGTHAAVVVSSLGVSMALQTCPVPHASTFFMAWFVSVSRHWILLAGAGTRLGRHVRL